MTVRQPSTARRPTPTTSKMAFGGAPDFARPVPSRPTLSLVAGSWIEAVKGLAWKTIDLMSPCGVSGMTKSLRGARTLQVSTVLLVAIVGCGENREEGVPDGPPPGVAGGPGPAGASKSSPEIKAIMVKLTKGPSSLTPTIGKGLEAEQPAWESIQPQTKEFAQLASTMGNYDPPKGSKDSWAKLTSDYAGTATELDRAAHAKDRNAALEAHGKLAKSCMSCHREHRMMGPGMGGGPGRGGPGFGPRGGPDGGPPPDGPGGPPPGGPNGPPPK
jgi:hypothetical protein